MHHLVDGLDLLGEVLIVAELARDEEEERLQRVLGQLEGVDEGRVVSHR